MITTVTLPWCIDGARREGLRQGGHEHCHRSMATKNTPLKRQGRPFYRTTTPGNMRFGCAVAVLPFKLIRPSSTS